MECLKDIYQGNYSGEVRNDLAHGFGKIEFKDGSSYEGGFLFDEYHGEGKFIFSDEGLLRVNGLMVSFMKAFVFLLMAINMKVNF